MKNEKWKMKNGKCLPSTNLDWHSTRLDGHLFHLHFRHWLVVSVACGCSYGIDNILAFGHFAKDRITGRQGIVGMHYEELRAVGIGTRISHGHRSGLVTALINC